MKKLKYSILLILTVACFLGITLDGLAQQKLPSHRKILKSMELANDYFTKKWPNPGLSITVKGITRTSNLWTRAVYYEGLMSLYKIDRKQTFYNYAVDWSQKHQWQPRDKVTTRSADNQCCGQTYLDLYVIDKKPERLNGIKECIDLMVNSDKKDDWYWVDALQMAMPVFAKMGAITNDNHYYEKMFDIYSYTKNVDGGNGLYNKTEHLWWRDKNFVPPYKEPNGANCYWARGNGWVLAALARVLETMPEDGPHRAEYVQTYKEMIAALIPLQRQDGFWNVSLMDSTHFGGKELTGTALFTYGIAWGINHKILDKKTYQPVVAKAWNALVNDCLHPDGMLGYVQGTGKEPKDGQPLGYDKVPDFEDYGLGCFLLAGSEVYRLVK
ncbi:MAG: glycoside hydrolase family 88 protein [Sphingobacteriales bacterium]